MVVLFPRTWAGGGDGAENHFRVKPRALPTPSCSLLSPLPTSTRLTPLLGRGRKEEACLARENYFPFWFTVASALRMPSLPSCQTHG